MRHYHELNGKRKAAKEKCSTQENGVGSCLSLVRIKMTANQYLQLGRDPPGVRLELVSGEIVVACQPRGRTRLCC